MSHILRQDRGTNTHRVPITPSLSALQDLGHRDQQRRNSQPDVVSRRDADSGHRLYLLSDKRTDSNTGPTSLPPHLARIRTRSTSTGLDSHVASNCRFGKQAATAFRNTGVGQCLAGEHRMTLPRMYRLSHQGLRVDRAGPARAGLATPHRYKLSRLGLTERSQRRAPTTRSFLRGAALQAPLFGSCIANVPGGRHARCAKRASR